MPPSRLKATITGSTNLIGKRSTDMPGSQR